jgi:hypothetical protein
MTRATDPSRESYRRGPAKGLRYPVATAVERAAREPAGRGGRERDQDGTA